MTAFVKVDSWHIEVENDQTHTLCGLTVRAHPQPDSGEHQASAWAEELPLHEKSCESCLRLALTTE